MARIQAELKRACLRSLYRQSQGSNPTPLSDILDAFQDQSFAAIQGGRLVTAHTGAGKQTQFALPQIWQAFTQEEFFSLTEELQQVHSDALVTLSAQGNAAPNDTQVFNVMMAADQLQTITSVQKDYSTLRWPTRL